MLKWAFRLFVIAVLTAAIGGVASFFTSPNWLIAAGAASALYFGTGFFLKTVFKRLVMIPFAAKGKVLRGATAEIHSVEAIEEPPPPSYEKDEDEEDGEDDELDELDESWNEGPQAYYRIDVTITPKPQSGAFALWDPSELMLVPIDTPSGMKGLDQAEENSGSVWDYEVWDEDAGTFSDEEIDKHGGPLRMRMVARVPAEMREVKFQYYFESFGEFLLPGSSFVKESPGGGERKEDRRGEEWKQMLAAQEKQHGSDAPALLPTLREVSRAFLGLEMYFEAKQIYERELVILQRHAPSDARALGAVLNNLAGACWHLGLMQEAEAACMQALEIKRSQLGENCLEAALTLKNLELLRGAGARPGAPT